VIYWDPSSKEIIYGQQMANPWSATKRINSNMYVITLQVMTFVPKVGFAVTVGPRIGGTPDPLPTFYHGSYMVLNSSKVVTENVTILGSGSFAVLEWSGAGNHKYQNILLTRKLIPIFHYLSSNMDAFHSFSVGVGPTVVNCEFAFMGDDFFNIHNRVFVVLAASNMSANKTKSIYVLDVGDILGLDYQPAYTMPVVKQGDTFDFYTLDSNKFIGGATVSSTSRVIDPTIINNATQILNIINAPPYNAQILPFEASMAQVWEVSFASTPFTIPPYSLIQFNAQSGQGAVVQNNYFHDSYDNSMRLQASFTLIESNIFERASAGISVVFDQFWLEGSLGLHNISIVNNTFKSVQGCTSTNSCVTSIGPDIKNLIIKGNVVQTQMNKGI